MRLSHVACRIDLVVHGQHHAHALGLLIHRDAGRIQQIAWAVKIRLRGIALGTDEHHWLVRFHGEIEPEGGFFQRVGTVGHDGAGYFVSIQRSLDGPAQHDPARRVHVIRRHVREIVDLNRCIFANVGNRGQQVIARYRRHWRVLDGIDLHGNRTARCNELYKGFVLGEGGAGNHQGEAHKYGFDFHGGIFIPER